MPATTIAFPGFVGPSYQLTDRYAAIERTVGWVQLVNETRQEAKFKYALDPAPANAAFSALPVPAPFNQPSRGLLEYRGQSYGVNGSVAFHIAQNGTYTSIGGVANDGNPASMVGNGNNQIFVASAGQGYVITAAGAGSTITSIPIGSFLGASDATFQDGYVLVTTPNSNQFQISGDDTTPVGDATKWDAANVSIQAGQADLLRAIRSSREYLRLFGYRRSQVYANVGAAGQTLFPFQSYNETFIETGCAATYSIADMGDAWMWIGEDARGMRACWIDPAFTPQRASTFAVEQFWQHYVSVADAVAFPYIWNGHLKYRVTFPSAILNTMTGRYTAATWEYDMTSSRIAGEPIWTEQQYNSATNGLIGRAELFHCYCYGLHLVGSGGADGNAGAIYKLSDSVYTDCGTDAHGAQDQREMVRDRICPHLWNNNNRVIYDRLQVECARGVGLSGSPATGTDPQMILRCSKNYGQTFGPEINAPVGKEGEYSEWVYWLRLGQARDMVFWLRYSEPTYMGLVNAELNLRIGS
jgi:hypothetical protein